MAPRVDALAGLVGLVTVAWLVNQVRTRRKKRDQIGVRPVEASSTQSESIAPFEEAAESIEQTENPDATFSRDGRLIREGNVKRFTQDDEHAEDRKSRLDFLTRLQTSIVGDGVPIETCFGRIRSLYCDWTGSAKAVGFVESFIQSAVLPLYANTHSLESRMGLQTSCFREEAREIIQLACNANRKKDVVVFVGNGATSAIQKLIDVMGLHAMNKLREEEFRCVIFVGPHEHTSNLVLWRETRAKVVVVPEKEDGSGLVDSTILLRLLEQHRDFTLKIGSFSACSNVTGVLERVDEITSVLHKQGALSFWDYASAAPYVPIDMNPTSVSENPIDRTFLAKDAVFISTHKFAGGVGGPGVLIAKKSLFNNNVPHACGGGTVYFVDEEGHRYLSDVVSREEGGTPNILGAIRAGLAFKIKRRIGPAIIEDREREICQMIAKRIGKVENLVVLGALASVRSDTSKSIACLPTIPCVIRAHGSRFLHHNYVVALLSDLFGIQARGGCLCAGPYVQSLLGLDKTKVEQLEAFLVNSVHQQEQYRPGVTRISLTYFMSNESIEYVLNALELIAKHGWRLAPLYRYENTAGEWGFRKNFQKFPERLWLADSFSPERLPQQDDRKGLSSFSEQLEKARNVLENPPQDAFRLEGSSISQPGEELRWWLEPWEASALLRGETVVAASHVFVDPKKYMECVQAHRSRVVASLSIDLSIAPQSSSDPSLSETNGKLNEIACPLLPRKSASSKRDAKQPRRAQLQQRQSSQRQVESSEGLEEDERKTALFETLARHQSLVQEMTTAELFPTIPNRIMRLVVQASKEWDMIRPNDRLLLGLSGGKDSLCLLHVLLQIQKRAPFRFEIACCTIDPGAGDAFNPEPLIPYVESLGIKYHFERAGIFESARDKLGNAASYCSFCARMKRGALYRVAREHGYTALVLAQHLDDFVESFFMSAIRNGSLRTMKANYVETKGEVRVIRPLCYVREKDTKDFSYSARLPVINENCPACFSAPTERERVKQFLKDQERLVPAFFESVRKAILPLMDGNVYQVLNEVETRLEKQRQDNPATAQPIRNRMDTKRNKSSAALKDQLFIPSEAEAGGLGNGEEEPDHEKNAENVHPESSNHSGAPGGLSVEPNGEAMNGNGLHPPAHHDGMVN